ncbi:serine protease 7 [Zeugodacus cucurbitae]|uniref:CLIP domain-containing serine protease n=1 Tax=Zeugodacus cucurbitae TaxID=28588 RepID=A0A0A1XK20_ZEUCU|nr:serine protease 7 [Zeugodacus cucurbitae]
MWRQVYRILLLLFSGILIAAHAGTYESAPTSCLNPNHNVGQCISIYDCRSLSFVLRHQLTAQYSFVRMSQCDGGAYASGKFPFVCCTNDTNFHDPNADREQRIVFPDMKTPEVPHSGGQRVAFITPPHCGALTISNKIFGGEEAEITEFSWMVKLEYKNERGFLQSECAGSLINERYVLTAAHCVIGPIEQKVGKLVSVLVGEQIAASSYNYNKYAHSAPSQRFDIEGVIVHDHYGYDQQSNIHEHNDIALIRLDKSVEFNNYIQPVCLPIPTLQKELTEGVVLTVAGWGHTGLSRHSSVKKKVHLPLYDMERCRYVFANYTAISEEQLCAGGVYYEDACTGDSGGPLMRLNSASWVLEGIVSFGRQSCGQENIPGIYTRVRSYIDWIADHMDTWQ